MQYILTEQEYKDLQQNDNKFKQLVMILHNIDTNKKTESAKLDSYQLLLENLSRASQDGTTDVVLHEWLKV